jgi:3'-phosphoadenosine 5'-phosphosulfate sulfotransferase (PAPS reductase)/FAD synthetase
MTGLPMLPTRFTPSKDVLAVLNGRQWVCSYSGGKDSTALVTWIEWLRRVGLVTVETPRLVMSDTTVEYPFLQSIAARLTAALTASGWRCEIVTPRIRERLYNRIFGIGNVPVHPGNRRSMRWCTRATKVDPMKRFARTLGPDVVQLSGVRWGESDTRDGKLKAAGCAAGGECGLPAPGEGVYSPVITWTTCKVLEWLSGEAGVSDAIADILPMTRELVGVYGVKRSADLFGGPTAATTMRFGCIGCPAITRDRVIAGKRARENPQWVHLRRLYGIWDALYANRNRCWRVYAEPPKKRRKPLAKNWRADVGVGPLRMAARQLHFAELLDIQRAAGVTLVTAEDEAFIRDCWERKVYPRGWSEADELTVPPEEPNLFAEA